MLGLPADIYLAVAEALDTASLSRLDVSCGAVQLRQGATFGPWHLLGLRAFFAVEADLDGAPQQFGGSGTKCLRSSGSAAGSLSLCRGGAHWKAHFQRFHQEASALEDEGEGFTASSRSRFRLDRLAARAHSGIYIELESLRDMPDFSFGVKGGDGDDAMGSLTFAPHKGTVQEIWLAPTGMGQSHTSSIKTAFHRLLEPVPCGQSARHFGMYVSFGRIAFYRRTGHQVSNHACVEDARECPAQGDRWHAFGDWETTGMIAGMQWACSNSLLLHLRCPMTCISRHVHITRVGGPPPKWPHSTGCQKP